ncbi:MAG: branched-chain amino acid ABC transporter permease [Christensenellales bacterium]|jgi:branched-chain amino acid transport system permease protein
MFLRFLFSGLVTGCMYGLIGIGYSTIYRASGMMTLAQGDLFSLGAYLCWTFYRLLGIPFVISVLMGMTILFIIGMLIEKGYIGAMMKKSAPIIFIVVGTVAIATIIQSAVTMLWPWSVLHFPPILKTTSIIIAGAEFRPEIFVAVGVSLACMIGMHFFMKKSKFGTAMRAAAQDPKAAQACGVNVAMTTRITWGIASAVAALGGCMLGPLYGLYAKLGQSIGEKGFAGAVAGGYGNMYGAMVGGLLIGLVEIFAAGYLDSSYKDFVAYGLLLLVLVVRPTGIFNEQAIRSR